MEPTNEQQQEKRRKTICLFGTSANPPTGNQGHVGIVRALSNKDFDEIRVVPVYSHPFSAKRKQLAEFDHRKNMCELAFGGIERATVDEAERIIYQQKEHPSSNGNIRVGTADLLEFYQSIEDNCDYTLCLGADTFLDLTGGKWRRTEEILDRIQGRFVVLYREMEEDSDTDAPTQRDQLKQAVAKLEETYGPNTIQLLKVPSLGAVSSTLVRSLSSELSLPSLEITTKEDELAELLLQTEERLKQMVNDKVLDYMKEHQLYGIGEEVIGAN